MLDKIQKKYSIILASSSPRRRDFFRKLKIHHKIIKPYADETKKKSENIRQYLIRIAGLKAQSALQALGAKIDNQNFIIIACDTIVLFKNKIFGKPYSKADAKQMLKTLAGKTHKVVSCIYVIKIANKRCFVKHKIVSTSVTFKRLSNEEISNYLLLNEYKDKAGAYAAQGAGAFMIKQIKGSFTNVIGLPLAELFELLSSI